MDNDAGGNALCRITLPCYVGESAVRIQIEFYGVDGRHVYGALLLDFFLHHFRHCRHELPFATFGLYIRTFLDDLSKMHQTLNGKALLCDRDSIVIVGVAYFNRRLAVGGQHLLFNYGPGGGDLTIGEDLLDPFYRPVRLTFDGLELDSSYMSSLIRDLERFLECQGVDCTNPYPWGTGTDIG